MVTSQILSRRARTLPRSTDLPFRVRVERDNVVWKTTAQIMAFVCVSLVIIAVMVTI